MIKVTQKGDFSKVTKWLERMREKVHLGILDKYGKKGVEALKANTPVDSGLTASSWYYTIQNDENSATATLTFSNSNINKNFPIALLIQYGHGTGTGGWVQGVDYINPALNPILDDMVMEISKEMRQA